jgi:ABC-type multidrug transport system fused ATPase/permease subunit
VQEEHTVPQRGFKIPIIVWLAAGLSTVIAVYSFGAFWALFVPWFLIPLPFRIFKRSFNFAEVQASLLLLPIVLFLGASATYDPYQADSLYFMAFNSLWFVVPLFLVLRSAGMQRWGKPEATIPKFSNPYQPDDKKPEPISFFIDHAPQDRLVADEMKGVFEKYGHTSTADMNSARAVVTLLSAFKTDTEADPQKQVVFPVLLQTTKPSKKLSKIQWIDFRRGVKNLDAMARLLPEPAKLLKALGIRPLGNQLVLPPVVMAMRYFVILLGIFSVGAILNYLYDFYDAGFDLVMGSEQAGGIILMLIFNLLLIGALAFFLVRHLVERKGWFASRARFLIGLVIFGFLIFYLQSADMTAFDMLASSGDMEAETSIAVFFPTMMYIVGGFGLMIFLFLRRADVRRWFPAKTRKPVKK